MRGREGGVGFFFVFENPRRGGGFSQKGGGGCEGAMRVSAGKWGGGGAIFYFGAEMPAKSSFASCELQCDECGEVAATIFMPIYLEELLQEVLPPENPPHLHSSIKASNLSTMEFWDRFCTRVERGESC